MPPIGKRSSERRRTNAETEPDIVDITGPVEIPPVVAGWHPLAKRWYTALTESGQHVFYEPSDWAYAHILADTLSSALREAKREKTVIRASLLATILDGMGKLLSTEADRRRMRVEIERDAGDQDDEAPEETAAERMKRELALVRPPADLVSIGPTWERNPDGSWKLPELTLGWQQIDWAAKYLRQPDGPDAGEPWAYTPEQARFLLWWYAVDRAGRFPFRTGTLRRAKGWGKDPFVATVCAIELCGPCRFGGFDDAGEPIAVEHPAAWVQIAAVSQKQTKNTMKLFPALFGEEIKSKHSLDIGKEQVLANHGRRAIEAVTSNPLSLEGNRTTFGVKNETQHWKENNDGHAMAEVMERNVTKARGGSARTLAMCNAHEPGADSDAERDFEAYQDIAEGRSRARLPLYDSLEAPPSIDLRDEEQLRHGLRIARGDSIWLDIDGHVETIYSPKTKPAQARQYYLNLLNAHSEAWIQPHEYDALLLHDGTGTPIPAAQVVADGEDITLGLDPSKTRDHTVLTCRVSDGYTWTIAAWDPADFDGELDREVVDRMVRTTAERYRVLGFFSDLHPFESYCDNWARDLPDLIVKAHPKHAVAFDMRTRTKDFTVECELVHDEIISKRFRHDGNKAVRRHFCNARRRPNAFGIGVGKESRESKKKIDGVPSCVLARAARRAVLSSGKRKPKRSGKATFA